MVPGAGATDPGDPTPSQKASFNWSRSMPSASAWRKSLFLSSFAISGSPSYELPTWIAASVPVQAGVKVDRVIALLRVLEEDRQLGQMHVPFLDVVFAGNRPQVGNLGVFGQTSS